MSDVGLLQEFFSSFCPFDSAIVSGEGELIFLAAKNPLSTGTLGIATQTVMKYLPLKPGEVALLNDPYSGGSTLNEYTFITKLVDAGPQSLWWAWRQSFGSAIALAKNIEEEGLRIPPTPVYQNKQMNQMILSAMSAHPLCPAGFSEWVAARCLEIEKRSYLFQVVLHRQKLVINKNTLKDYLAECRRVVHDKVSEAASGETRLEVFLENKEMIRLHLEIHDGLVKMDFSGSSPSKTHLLTESAAYGVCFASLAKFYGFETLVNTGAFSVLQVTKPSSCLLNAKYPAPLGVGSLAVQAALQSVIAMALAHIHTKRQKALCAFCAMELELKNEQGQVLHLRLPGGAGASTESHFAPFAFGETLSEDVSVEKMERFWPVRVDRFDFRNSGYGKGAFEGGRGLTLKFTALGPMDMQWRTDFTKHRSKIPREASFGDHGEIKIHRGPDEKNLAAAGQMQLQPGDTLTFCSGVGGGWGHASTAAAEE